MALGVLVAGVLVGGVLAAGADWLLVVVGRLAAVDVDVDFRWSANMTIPAMTIIVMTVVTSLVFDCFSYIGCIASPCARLIMSRL